MSALESGIGRYLHRNGLISAEVETYHPRTRDRSDLQVNICKRTEVLFVNRETTDLSSYYREKEIENDGRTSQSIVDKRTISTPTPQDSERRFQSLRELITNRRICDFGTGPGLFLYRAKAVANEISGVEVNQLHASALRRNGFRIEADIDAFAEKSFDVVTLFHVLEHLPEPIEILRKIRSRMAINARLVVEVPHACDFLHKTLKCEAFKNFTFWSEHLVLHTAQSLRQVLHLGGFSSIVVKGYQRYGFENHLHWLVEGKPGGHASWAHLKHDRLNEGYAEMLGAIGQTDTLLAYATV